MMLMMLVMPIAVGIMSPVLVKYGFPVDQQGAYGWASGWVGGCSKSQAQFQFAACVANCSCPNKPNRITVTS
jgi:hypothetical protein